MFRDGALQSINFFLHLPSAGYVVCMAVGVNYNKKIKSGLRYLLLLKVFRANDQSREHFDIL